VSLLDHPALRDLHQMYADNPEERWRLLQWIERWCVEGVVQEMVSQEEFSMSRTHVPQFIRGKLPVMIAKTMAHEVIEFTEEERDDLSMAKVFRARIVALRHTPTHE
jgi:hypothetical protein